MPVGRALDDVRIRRNAGIIGDRYSVAAQTGNYGWALYRIEEVERARPYLLAQARGDRAAAQRWAQEALRRQPAWDEAQAISDWAA